MKLLTQGQCARMLANGCFNAGREKTRDFEPIVKLFCSWGAATWLLSELDPECTDIAFGLCDLGMGCPELGSVNLAELAGVTGLGGLLRCFSTNGPPCSRGLIVLSEQCSACIDQVPAWHHVTTLPPYVMSLGMCCGRWASLSAPGLLLN
jgi:hypothetical protein